MKPHAGYLAAASIHHASNENSIYHSHQPVSRDCRHRDPKISSRGLGPGLRAAQSNPPDPYMSRTRSPSINTDYRLLRFASLVGNLGYYRCPACSAGDVSWQVAYPPLKSLPVPASTLSFVHTAGCHRCSISTRISTFPLITGSRVPVSLPPYRHLQ